MGNDWFGKFINDLLQYIPFMAMAMWGGTVNYISKLRSNQSAFSVAVLIGEWSTSGFTGLLVGFACVRMELSWEASMFLVGMAGHASARTLFLAQKIYEKWLNGVNFGDKK